MFKKRQKNFSFCASNILLSLRIFSYWFLRIRDPLLQDIPFLPLPLQWLLNAVWNPVPSKVL
jgi:hypothetical protein